MEALKETLCKECKCHDQENFEEVALHYALRQKHERCIEKLIAAGADVNWHSQTSMYTPLMRAAESGSVENTERLLEAGADVNLGEWNYSALQFAAYEGNAGCVDVLIKAGADVNRATTGYNSAAIIGAAMAGSVECTKLLIAAGADVNLKHQYDRSPIIQAVKNGYTEIVKVLLEAGANVNDTEYGDGSNTIMLAACDGYDETVDILIKAGANVNRVYNDHTALILAAECYKEGIETPPSKYKRCLEMLLNSGADVNAKPGGFSALIIACRNGFDDGVEILMDAGADVNMIGDKGLTPLMEAAANGHVRCAELILEAGVDVNFQNTEGLTALMCVGSGSPMFDYDEREIHLKEAMDKRDCLGSVKLLLKSGAKLNLIDTCSRNALQHQVELYDGSAGSDDICLLLYAAGETLGGRIVKKLRDCLKSEYLNLKHLCRGAIRKHLLHMNRHQYLFGRIPLLGLPPSLTKFLLHNVNLEE